MARVPTVPGYLLYARDLISHPMIAKKSANEIGNRKPRKLVFIKGVEHIPEKQRHLILAPKSFIALLSLEKDFPIFQLVKFACISLV